MPQSHVQSSEDIPAESRVDRLACSAARAAQTLAGVHTEPKNQALLRMADLLRDRSAEIVQANTEDIEAARDAGIEGALLDRLGFGLAKIQSRIGSLHKIAALPDPVGHIVAASKTPNGLTASRVRVPLGVILMIYEARPHVTVNAGAFALKSGNAIICKGGSEAKRCNALLAQLWREAVDGAGLPADSVQVVSLSHDEVDDLLQRSEQISLVIPRGGKNLIRAVAERSSIPVIKHFEGVCHVYVGQRADTAKALPIVLDSKLLMPAVCNAAETVLLDASLHHWLPFLVNALVGSGVQVRGCPAVCATLPNVRPATEEDWHTEYLDKIVSLRMVRDIAEAIEHINHYGSGHTDAIVTEDYSAAQRFTREVDSGVVLVNASTMFCDGETLGMGAEIGISTDKLHARGPMGLEELTTYKHVIWGEGQVMGEQFALSGDDRCGQPFCGPAQGS